MNHYWVTSPEIELYSCCAALALDPPEYGHCVASIEAPTKRAAIVAAIKHPNMRDWVDRQRGDDLPPMAGLKAENARCPHGRCGCQMCNERCAECEAEIIEVEL